MTTKEEDKRPWNEIYQRLLKLKKKMELKEKSPSSKAYNFRMYDIVLDRQTPSKATKEMGDPKTLINMAMQLFSGLNESTKDEGNFKFLSPRIAPLMPDKMPTSKSILSPTLLSFYDDNNTIASIPSILKLSNIGDKEKNEIMTLLMQMSGTTNAIEEATNVLKELNFMDISDELNDVNTRINTVYDGLKSSFNRRQKRDLDKSGFTFMDKQQLDHMYNNKEFKFPKDSLDFEDYLSLEYDQKTEALWNSIERIALEESVEDYKLRLRRRRRALGLANAFSAVVLGPYMFAPSFGLTILGPVILSPNIFSPAILNPSILSPYILSPAIGLTNILSPYVLSPMILNPVLLAPLILSPYVLSPNILTPNLLSPLILSPLVLSPDILSPGGLGGAVLSPAVASPAILTESFLMATILSPTIFS
ncbi:unnamed protein product [Bursaphelenchus xylophilus]|uniref:(pine wood nematode) hypothetical protein n=1 Tax=Bursaphelenchus xylophilus TaxID=6326 RepID=A0A1I7SSG4_BURXY|nr:unnamed protein product [Bursaphelenchus xylophilus]CAG9097577.1 unnamed protein product [Bursaphelenchus xylophilus]